MLTGLTRHPRAPGLLIQPGSASGLLLLLSLLAHPGAPGWLLSHTRSAGRFLRSRVGLGWAALLRLLVPRVCGSVLLRPLCGAGQTPAACRGGFFRTPHRCAP